MEEFYIRLICLSFILKKRGILTTINRASPVDSHFIRSHGHVFGAATVSSPSLARPRFDQGLLDWLLLVTRKNKR